MLHAEDTGVDYLWDFFDNVFKAAMEMGDGVIKKVGLQESPHSDKRFAIRSFSQILSPSISFHF